MATASYREGSDLPPEWTATMKVKPDPLLEELEKAEFSVAKINVAAHGLQLIIRDNHLRYGESKAGQFLETILLETEKLEHGARRAYQRQKAGRDMMVRIHASDEELKQGKLTITFEPIATRNDHTKEQLNRIIEVLELARAADHINGN